MYRCAGPNCGTLKGATDRWWLMWTSFLEFNRPVLYLCPWDDEIAVREGTLHVCGELAPSACSLSSWEMSGKTSALPACNAQAALTNK